MIRYFEPSLRKWETLKNHISCLHSITYILGMYCKTFFHMEISAIMWVYMYAYMHTYFRRKPLLLTRTFYEKQPAYYILIVCMDVYVCLWAYVCVLVYICNLQSFVRQNIYSFTYGSMGTKISTYIHEYIIHA